MKNEVKSFFETYVFYLAYAKHFSGTLFNAPV